jgi:hypothetical protein
MSSEEWKRKFIHPEYGRGMTLEHTLVVCVKQNADYRVSAGHA